MVVAAGVLAAGGILVWVPAWITVIQLLSVAWVALLAFVGPQTVPLLIALTIALLIAPALQLIQHWDKVVVLRFGKFQRVRGPGLFMMIPLADRIARFVGTRIRATDFSAEKTLTQDTVPVHVDALTFWMVWDVQRAVLEVENFVEAVILSAQTALRDAIGAHDLSKLLSERDRLGQEIQETLDSKTNPWGITILSLSSPTS